MMIFECLEVRCPIMKTPSFPIWRIATLVALLLEKLTSETRFFTISQKIDNFQKKIIKE